MTTWTVRLLRVGGFRLDAGCMFGLIPRVVWSKWFPPGVIDDANRMPLQQNALLLESGGVRVLVEPGIGDKLSPKEHAIYAQELTPRGTPRTIVDALHEVGCRPQDIDAVIVTHLHFDHAGGLTRAGGADPARPALTFPNARIIVQRREWEDALAGRSTMNKTYLSTHLTPDVRERLMLIDEERQVLPGLSVFRVPGHTWGQQCVHIRARAGRDVVFTNDVMPTTLHARPTTNLAYDVEPYTSMLQRTRLLDAAAERAWTLVLDHEPGDPVVRVQRDPDHPGQHRLIQTGEREL